MSKKFTLNQLTEGIRSRNVGQEGKRLTEKWSRTGLLRGLEDTNRENMAMMLENQAAQLLRESNTASDAGGFTNIAFPIVRRVFGGLVANELVSIQPMSLPSGLLFYLDYTYGSDVGGAYSEGDSIYGSPSGRSLQSGADGSGGQYDLAGSGFSAGPHNQVTGVTATLETVLTAQGISGYDELVGVGADWAVYAIELTALGDHDRSSVKSWSITGLLDSDSPPVAMSTVASSVQSGTSQNLRRCNVVGNWSAGSFTARPLDGTHVLMLVQQSGSDAGANSSIAVVNHPLADTVAVAAGGKATSDPQWESNDFDGSPVIPEFDIKIESIAVVAQTRKLRARWSPELAQDLNAYHSMDAEVELTQILSEQVALEIDREILNDLLVGANGANLFWSRAPGRFLDKNTGTAIDTADGSGTATYESLAFTGTVREWYETLTETIIDVANQIHRKTLRGSANFIVVGPDVATILESSVMYKPNYKLDGQGQVGSSFSIGAEKVGALSNRFTVYKDPYFPRNKILVGFKGGSYLETGYVYAPYVPLIVTPTIFQPDDFTPRKGVMTRYGKKMVRSDFYGTVTVLDMHII